MDLSTRYLGLDLGSPLIAGAGPLTRDLDTVRRLEDAGAAAVVLPSIFEEQIEEEQRVIERLVGAGTDTYGEALSYFPAGTGHSTGPGRALELVRRAAAALRIPVIASLNGTTERGWTSYASQIEQAGATALELNIYFIPADPELTGRAVERRYLDIVGAVRASVSIPVAVKIGPNFSAPGHFARQLAAAGADGLVLFNRFYQPDIDLARLALAPDLDLSRPAEIRQPLLWIGILAGRIKASLAASTGVDGPDEVVKYLLAGADTVMTTAALLRHGVEHMRVLRSGLEAWLSARELGSIDAMRGRLSHRHLASRDGFERANYIRMLQGYRLDSE